MNPWYLAAILGGAYAVSKMSSAATTAATKTAQKKLAVAPHMTALGGGGTPLEQLQAAIKDGQALIQGWASATDDSWLDTNHNAIVFSNNALGHWFALLGGHQIVNGRETGRTYGTSAYAKQHPELASEMGRLIHTYAVILDLMNKRWAAGGTAPRGTLSGGLTHKGGAGAGGSQVKSAKDLISKAQGIINSFPPDGSDASAYLAWTAASAAQVPGIISDIQSLVASASNTQQDIQTAMAFIPQLTQLVSKAASQAGSGSGSGVTDTSGTTTTPVDSSGGSSGDGSSGGTTDGGAGF